MQPVLNAPRSLRTDVPVDLWGGTASPPTPAIGSSAILLPCQSCGLQVSPRTTFAMPAPAARQSPGVSPVPSTMGFPHAGQASQATRSHSPALHTVVHTSGHVHAQTPAQPPGLPIAQLSHSASWRFAPPDEITPRLSNAAAQSLVSPLYAWPSGIARAASAPRLSFPSEERHSAATGDFRRTPSFSSLQPQPFEVGEVRRTPRTSAGLPQGSCAADARPPRQRLVAVEVLPVACSKRADSPLRRYSAPSGNKCVWDDESPVPNISAHSPSALLASTSSMAMTYLVAEPMDSLGPKSHPRACRNNRHDEAQSPGISNRSGGSDASTVAVPLFPRPIRVSSAGPMTARELEGSSPTEDVGRRHMAPLPHSPPQKITPKEFPGDFSGVPLEEHAGRSAEQEMAEMLLRPVAESLERLRSCIEVSSPLSMTPCKTRDKGSAAKISPDDRPFNPGSGSVWASPSPISQFQLSREELLTTSAGGTLRQASSPDGTAQSPGLLEELSPSAILVHRHGAEVAEPIADVSQASLAVSSSPNSSGFLGGDGNILTEALSRLEGQLGALESILAAVEMSSNGTKPPACKDAGSMHRWTGTGANCMHLKQ